ncbi:hypothetical protein HMPREF9440_01537 [Sutterella parvirubra YIT 11816]|uniref:Uncharacterized protein n=1 Tax=Sutterella parvirubra YIT 11816 TaxID=762967 RepID=H3KFL9_9BURK|nr:hypothetical protein HMPREF9440_01537 [Sutterella parvirubra YIT 11816]
MTASKWASLLTWTGAEAGVGLPEGWAGCLPSSLPAPSALPGSLSALPFSFSDFGFSLSFSLSLPFWPDAAEGSSPEGFSAELFEPGFAPAPDEPGLPGFGADAAGLPEG